ncbi:MULTISPECIES: hypothetical protein [Methylobacterium]|uniref:Protein of unassigned function n=1 Tax=Methylobacterium oryzae CBMB20 TaxID=693986 RepID=A0A088B2G7_9HYPH|nr:MULTISPECIES: hypothetical protein [Methylobacterium]AGO88455.1 protein of unassigned function [Methylobacterium oryzae CBMB20]AIQ89338.1 protein of unassigned function [Methylobacterium oryzae CBMB20]
MATDALAEAGFLIKDPFGCRRRPERIAGKPMRVWVVRRELVAPHATAAKMD